MTRRNGGFRAAATTARSRRRPGDFCAVSEGFRYGRSGQVDAKKLVSGYGKFGLSLKLTDASWSQIIASASCCRRARSMKTASGHASRSATCLEELGNKAIADAMGTGLYNQRGVHFRQVGGKQERRLLPSTATGQNGRLFHGRSLRACSKTLRLDTIGKRNGTTPTMTLGGACRYGIPPVASRRTSAGESPSSTSRLRSSEGAPFI